MRSALAKKLSVLIASAAVLCSPQVLAESIYDKIDNVLFGEAIFEYEQGVPYNTMAMLDSGVKRDIYGEEEHLASMFLADTMAQFHLEEEALRLYQNVARQATQKSVRQSAWLKAAKLAFKLNLLAVAETALENSTGTLSETNDADAIMLKAHLLLLNEKPDEALQLLTTPPVASIWALYQYYNAGVTLLSKFKNKQGALLLHNITSLDSDDPEVSALKDKAALSLGYSLMQLGQPRKARTYFEKIRLGGIMSNMALLGMGWSHAKEDNYERALIYWQELSQAQHVDTYQLESLLAMPYAYSKLDAPRLAAQKYQATLKRYQDIITEIDKALKGGFIHKLITKTSTQPKGDAQWLHSSLEDGSPNDKVLTGLLLESPEFQSTLRHYRYLVAQNTQASHQKNRIQALKNNSDIMLISGDLAKMNILHQKMQKQLNIALQSARSGIETLATEILERHRTQLEQYSQQARFSLAQAIENASILSDD